MMVTMEDQQERLERQDG